MKEWSQAVNDWGYEGLGLGGAIHVGLGHLVNKRKVGVMPSPVLLLAKWSEFSIIIIIISFKLRHTPTSSFDANLL